MSSIIWLSVQKNHTEMSASTHSTEQHHTDLWSAFLWVHKWVQNGNVCLPTRIFSLNWHLCCNRWKSKVQRPGRALFLFLLWETNLMKGGERRRKKEKRERNPQFCHSLWWKCSFKIPFSLRKTCLSHSLHRCQIKFDLQYLVCWSIVHMTFCNITQHKAINHTESE